MNIFLTGEVQIGKSTIINKVIAQLPEGYNVGGFKTITIENGQPQGGDVHIIPAIIRPEGFDKSNRIGIRYGKARGYDAFTEVFEHEGVRLLLNCKACDLIIMDEIGTMEKDAQNYNRLLMELLDEGKNILGVIQPKKSELLDFIRAHKKTKLITVTRDNRNGLAEEISSCLNIIKQ
ncbi:nucleoside-triphosphatase [Eubacteriales bacterium OttesenSCG-928-K08]|nr:nucleoside-triphosphatase [Eubacteriales bacterium OttesenSCG-928-K08]